MTGDHGRALNARHPS